MVGVTADSPLVTSRWIRLALNFLFWRSFGRARSHVIVVVKSGRACLRVGLAAHLASQSSVTGISASLQALVLPGALSILFLSFFKTAVFYTRGCGSPARASFIVDLSGTLRYMAAHRTDIPRCFNRSFSPPYIAQLLLFKERDRDPSAGAGFPPLRPHWTCESQASYTFEA